MALSTSTNIYPIGNSVFIGATTASQQVYVTAPGSNISALLIENLDATNDVFVNYSTGSTSTATVPTTGTPQPGVAVQANSNKVINIAAVGATFDSNVTVSLALAIPGATAANVLITPVV